MGATPAFSSAVLQSPIKDVSARAWQGLAFSGVHQPQGREGARSWSAGDRARPRRRGDRI